MKIHNLIAVAAIMVLFSCALSCRKEEQVRSAVSDGHFEAGQKVRITASIDLGADTRMTGALNKSDGKINFKWETGDKIKVTVGGSSSYFTLSSGDNGKTVGTFEGIMPASGTTFDVQFPATGVPAAALASQTYVADGVPHNMMLATKTGCTLGNQFSLEPQYAVLRLNLWSPDGTTVKKIVVSNTTTPASTNVYTLNVSAGVKTSTTDSTAFCMIVPPGNWNFSADIYGEQGSSSSVFLNALHKTSTTSYYFTQGAILDMPKREVGHMFSVSATKKVKFYNKIKTNLVKNVNWVSETEQYTCKTAWDSNNIGQFYWSSTEPQLYSETYSGSSASASDVFALAEGNNISLISGETGHYVLSYYEFDYLRSTRTNASSLIKEGVEVCGVSNCLILAPDDYKGGALLSKYDSTTSPTWQEAEEAGLVCLPPAPYRDGTTFSSDGCGYYLTSTLKSGDPNSYMVFSFPSSASPAPATSLLRSQGSAIRLVRTAN